MHLQKFFSSSQPEPLYPIDSNVSFSPPISSWIKFFFFSFCYHGKTHITQNLPSQPFLSVQFSGIEYVHHHPSPELLLFWKTETLCPFTILINFWRIYLWALGGKQTQKAYNIMQTSENIQEHFEKEESYEEGLFYHTLSQNIDLQRSKQCVTGTRPNG